MRLFGPGAQELLRGVDDTGSLSRAAKDMGMSYSKAWRMVDEIERGLDVRLLERQTGGLTGGGSRLTAEGSLVLERFEAFIRDADDMLEVLFHKHFADLPYGVAPGSDAGPATHPRQDQGSCAPAIGSAASYGHGTTPPGV
jgi:molybdate transport system regulatory protein